jgi:hypothetical protein
MGIHLIARLPLVALCGLSLCACAHSPTAPRTTKEPVVMASAEAEPANAAKINAGQLLSRLLDLIKSSKSIGDFTPDRVNAAMQLQDFSLGPGHFQYGGILTDNWSYGLEVDQASVHGPRVALEFVDKTPSRDAAMGDICQVDFDRFASELKGAGFKQDTVYGEHGITVYHRFDRPDLSIKISTNGEASDATGEIGRTCIRLITIQ